MTDLSCSIQYKQDQAVVVTGLVCIYFSVWWVEAVLFQPSNCSQGLSSTEKGIL